MMFLLILLVENWEAYFYLGTKFMFVKRKWCGKIELILTSENPVSSKIESLTSSGWPDFIFAPKIAHISKAE